MQLVEASTQTYREPQPLIHPELSKRERHALTHIAKMAQKQNILNESLEAYTTMTTYACFQHNITHNAILNRYVKSRHSCVRCNKE